MKTNHDGDCTIYSALINGRPEDGICTCGYGFQLKRERFGDNTEMYSAELRTKLETRNSLNLLRKLSKQDTLESLSEGEQ